MNPKDACEVTVCRQNKCVAAPLACDLCDPKTGCKNPADVATDTTTAPDGTTTTTTTKDTGATTTDNTPVTSADEVEDPADTTKRHNTVTGLSVFLGIIAAAFVILAIYMGVISVRY
jgi:hypothetical protein